MTNTPEKWSCLNTFLWFHCLCRSPPSGHVIAAAAAAAASRDPAFRHKGSGLVQMSVKRHETLKGRVGKRRRRRKPRKEPRGSCTEKKMDLGEKKKLKRWRSDWSGRKKINWGSCSQEPWRRKREQEDKNGWWHHKRHGKESEELSGGLGRKELLVAPDRAVSECLACLETGGVRGWDTARGPNRTSVVISWNFLQRIDRGLSHRCPEPDLRSAGQLRCSRWKETWSLSSRFQVRINPLHWWVNPFN